MSAEIKLMILFKLAGSAQHAKIGADGNGFLFVDLQSGKGSFLRNQLIKSYWLNDGDEITIGKHLLKFTNPKMNKQIKKQSPAINNTMQMDTKRFRDLIRKNK